MADPFDFEQFQLALPALHDEGDRGLALEILWALVGRSRHLTHAEREEVERAMGDFTCDYLDESLARLQYVLLQHASTIVQRSQAVAGIAIRTSSH